MEKTCETIVGLKPDLTPQICGEPGVTIGEVTRCVKHWARAREKANVHREHERYEKP